jgi:integrase
MPKISKDRPHWLLHPAWPARDRAGWLSAVAPPHALDIPTYAQTLSPTSLATIERAYGRFLNWLENSGELDKHAGPEKRPTAERLARYLRSLEALGYSGQTKLLLLSGLRSAMKILEPNQDWLWIVRPGGTPILSSLRALDRPNVVPVPKSSDLYLWGLELVDTAPRAARSRGPLLQVRDGVMICLMAARPIRCRTMAGLQLGRHLLQTEQQWRLAVDGTDMKNGRSLDVPLPSSLGPRLHRYLDEVRPLLLKGRESASVWITPRCGTPIKPVGITQMLYLRSVKRFGFRFGGHRFRHAAATSAVSEDPSSPGLAASILAVGTAMVRKHYDRSDELVAIQGFHDALAAERQALKGRALRMFAEHDPFRTDGPEPFELSDDRSGLAFESDNA